MIATNDTFHNDHGTQCEEETGCMLVELHSEEREKEKETTLAILT